MPLPMAGWHKLPLCVMDLPHMHGCTAVPLCVCRPKNLSTSGAHNPLLLPLRCELSSLQCVRPSSEACRSGITCLPTDRGGFRPPARLWRSASGARPRWWVWRRLDARRRLQRLSSIHGHRFRAERVRHRADGRGRCGATPRVGTAASRRCQIVEDSRGQQVVGISHCGICGRSLRNCLCGWPRDLVGRRLLERTAGRCAASARRERRAWRTTVSLRSSRVGSRRAHASCAARRAAPQSEWSRRPRASHQQGTGWPHRACHVPARGSRLQRSR